MIADISIIDKSYGDKVLYRDFSLRLSAREKVGLIGRNGTGKTTLFNIMTGLDKDFAGDVAINKRTVVISSRQEHHGFEDAPVLAYILDDLPEYAKLKHILDTYPAAMDDNMSKIHTYSNAMERFMALDYYMVEDEIRRSLNAYGLSDDKVDGTISMLSGGQKRFVELVKVQHAKADLALIDEPTNHMDFVAKELFLDWFNNTKEAVVVITHDRDVLQAVDRIVEIRDGRAYSFTGNYDAYLRTNTTKITSEVTEFSMTQRRIANLQEDIIRFRRFKERARDPGTISRFKSLQQKAEKELGSLQTKEKPTFWIDRESAQNLNVKMTNAYQQHKARNITVNARTVESTTSRQLVDVSKLSLGYNKPLFTDVSFQLREGERVRLHGRNGAGKTTLVQAILAKAGDQEKADVQVASDVLAKAASRTPGVKSQTAGPTIMAGTIATERELTIGIYEQEIDGRLLSVKLGAAIEKVYLDKDVKISDQKIKQLLSDYLFEPNTDGDVPLSRLSGGQKARFQLIAMLANDPQLLILDEPTNHLDLPSIEELENALQKYKGAILYVSHDSYFTGHIGGETVPIGQ